MPSAFVPHAPTARERKRATPSARTTSGRTKAAKPKNWSAPSANEAPTRPAQLPGRASGDNLWFHGYNLDVSIQK